MNISQEGILTLIRSALMQKSFDLPENFNIDDAFPCICQHNIQPMCYCGALLCGIPNTGTTMKKLFNAYCSAVLVVTRQDQAIAQLFSMFEINGIDYMPLKGCKMRPCYPLPELRAMGDADVLIRMEQYDQIEVLIKELGYEFYEKTDYDISWVSKSLHLELHHLIHSPKEKSHTAIFEGGWDIAKQETGHCWSMTPEDEWLYQFGHFTKHYIAGLGIRHAVDLWVYLRNHPELDNAYIERQLARLDLNEFHSNIRYMLSVWFDGAQSTEHSDFITNYIFLSGSWGTEENRVLSKVVTSAGNISILQRIFKSMLTALFPSRENVERTFSFVTKHRWLYVPMLIIRPFYRLFFEYGVSRRWLHILSNYNHKKIDVKQQQFSYVGLKNINQ